MSAAFKTTADSSITSYRVTVRDGCTLVEGAMPMSHAGALMQAAGTDAVVSPQLAQLTHCTFAWGPRVDVDKLVDHLVAEAQRITANDPPIKRWLEYGERGESSNAMAHSMWTDRPVGWIVSRNVEAYPHDPDDFRRCLLLLDMVPEFVPRLPIMARVNPVWAALVRHWGDISIQFVREAGDAWRTEPKGAPKTYELMKEVIKGATA